MLSNKGRVHAFNRVLGLLKACRGGGVSAGCFTAIGLFRPNPYAGHG